MDNTWRYEGPWWGRLIRGDGEGRRGGGLLLLHCLLLPKLEILRLLKVVNRQLLLLQTARLAIENVVHSRPINGRLLDIGLASWVDRKKVGVHVEPRGSTGMLAVKA